VRLDVDLPEKFRSAFEPHRYKSIRGGRGSAKSWSVARALLLIGAERPLRIICARETQKSIRDSVHKLLVDQIARLRLAAHYKIQQVQITGNKEHRVQNEEGERETLRTEFVFWGLSDLTAASIKSFERANVVWLEEGQAVSESSWTILTPTIRSAGSEIWVTWNPGLDTDPTWKRLITQPFPDTLDIEMNWRDNPWFNDILEQERQHALRTMPKADYDNIWEGKPLPAVSGAIYADEIATMFTEGRVGDFPHDPRQMVYPVFDLGTNNNMAIGLWQRAGSRMTCLEALATSQPPEGLTGISVADWGRFLKNCRPQYTWGTMFLPHDAQHGNRQSGQTDEQVMQDLGWTVHVIERTSHVNDDIRQARLMFPTLYINKPKCERLIESLKRYRRNVPSTTQEPTMPVHDEWSHMADMLRYANQAGPYMTNMAGLKLPPLKFAPQTV
jgi:phage terminase large subunit